MKQQKKKGAERKQKNIKELRAVYRTPQSLTQKYIRRFEMKGGGRELKDEASPASVFSLMLIIYVLCAFYYYYLFIYLPFSAACPFFKGITDRGSRTKLLS